MSSRRLVLACAVVALAAAAPSFGQAQSPGIRIQRSDVVANRCLDCHEGIEGINDAMDRRWGANTNCSTCHKGHPKARTKDEAHAGLIAKPGDLRVVAETCGTCHSTFGQLRGIQGPEGSDQVDRVLRSPMALAQSEIAAVRYVWGAQASPTARYGVRSATSLGDAMPPETLPGVAALPPASQSPADHLLRAQCLQCHLWTQPPPGGPVFRGAGCAACHVLYAPDGRSRSGDPSISKVEAGHPARHEIVRLVPDDRCLTCHRDEGLGIGWNYTGWLRPRGEGQAAAPSLDTGALPVPPDVHAAAGMACIDCHDSYDVHGDGLVHNRSRTAVGIQCTTCHGTAGTPPTFRTTRGHQLRHVQVRDGAAVLTTKLGGVALTIPILGRRTGPAAEDPHRVPGHGDGSDGVTPVTCVACHAGEQVHRYARHAMFDQRQAVPTDWAEGVGGRNEVRVIQGRWTVRDGWNAVGLPMVGIDAAGGADAMFPTWHAVRTVVDGLGRTVAEREIAQTQDGRYGLGFRTGDPHRTRRVGRACESCHGDLAAFGHGSGRIDLGRMQWPLLSAPDQVADHEGTAIAAFTVEGERPLNYVELQGVLRRPACLVCHAGRPPAGPMAPDRTPPEADRAHAARQGRSLRDVPEPEPLSETAAPMPGEADRAILPTPKEAAGLPAPEMPAVSAPPRPAEREERRQIPPEPPSARERSEPPELSPFIGQ